MVQSIKQYKPDNDLQDKRQVLVDSFILLANIYFFVLFINRIEIIPREIIKTKKTRG